MSSDVQIAKRTLGRTNIEVTPIGLGMMEFSGGGGLMGSAFPIIQQEEKNAAVKAGLDGGVNWFDTAELYGAGVSETSLATALKAAGKTDGDVVVATKWWPLFRTAHNILKTIDDRLRFLDGYSIGVYMMHQPFGFSSPEAEMDAMAELVKAGKIRSAGASLQLSRNSFILFLCPKLTGSENTDKSEAILGTVTNCGFENRRN